MAVKTTLNISPKVFVGLACGLGVAALTALAEHLSPGLFASLGVWQTPALVLTSTVVAQGAAWLKSEEAKVDAETGEAPVEEAAAPVAEAIVSAVLPAAPVYPSVVDSGLPVTLN